MLKGENGNLNGLPKQEHTWHKHVLGRTAMERRAEKSRTKAGNEM